MVSADSFADVAARFESLHSRIDALEAALRDDSSAATKSQRSEIETDDDRNLDDGGDGPSTTTLSIPSTSASPASSPQRRLSRELLAQGIPQDRFAFTRVREDYYELSLEDRRECLQAVSCSRLCKTLLLENTKARKFNEREETRSAELTPRQRAALSEHFFVIVQYHSARGFDAERLKKELLARTDGFAPAKAFNLRLAKDGVAEALTGFVHGAVTPVGASCGLLGSRGQVVSRGQQQQQRGRGEGEGEGEGEGARGEIPLVLSSRVARLPEFWMGGGEVDLKLCASTEDFVRAYDPIVADVMHGDEEGEEEGE